MLKYIIKKLRHYTDRKARDNALLVKSHNKIEEHAVEYGELPNKLYLTDIQYKGLIKLCISLGMNKAGNGDMCQNISAFMKNKLHFNFAVYRLDNVFVIVNYSEYIRFIMSG